MTTLAQWLQTQLRTSGLTQQAASVHAGVSAATISQMLNQGHIPRIEILFRLADYFQTPREQVLRIAARMPVGDDPHGEDDYLIEELVEEFRQVPDAWKEEAVRQIAMFRRLAEMPSVRFIGEEEGDRDPDQEPGA
jgi:transcriptional regulator with XRE-family HTH domain